MQNPDFFWLAKSCCLYIASAVSQKPQILEVIDNKGKLHLMESESKSLNIAQMKFVEYADTVFVPNFLANFWHLYIIVS
jgi:hypothetical protein